MSFQVIKASDRVASMIEWFTGICGDITDFIVGSKIRTKFETIAVEMEAQDFAWYQALKKAIPTAIYQAFDFTLLPAQKATGFVKFSLPEAPSTASTIPAGTQVSTGSGTTSAEVFFITTAQASIAPGTTMTVVPIAAVVAGASGNVSANSINTIPTAITGISGLTVTNETAIINGEDRETETERRIRFIEYVSTLSRGTIKAVEYGAKTAVIYDASGAPVETVQDAIIYEPFMHDQTKPVGVFECYVYNGSGDTSDALIAAVENAINGHYLDGVTVPGWKAAGVICNVIKATETVLNVTADITVTAGYNLSATETAATNVADDYIYGLGIGKQFIYNELVERLMGIQGVYNVAITTPDADMTPAYNEVFIPGCKVMTVNQL